MLMHHLAQNCCGRTHGLDSVRNVRGSWCLVFRNIKKFVKKVFENKTNHIEKVIKMCTYYGRDTHNAHLDIVCFCMGWKRFGLELFSAFSKWKLRNTSCYHTGVIMRLSSNETGQERVIIWDPAAVWYLIG